MRSQRILVCTLVATLGAGWCSAQTQDTSVDAARAAQQNAITDRYLTAVQVEIASKVDTRDATPGEEVDAKLLQSATLADGTALPRGARLVGHVVQTRGGGPEQGGAVLVLTFDQAEVKPGQKIPVRCVIRAVTQMAGVGPAPRLPAMSAPVTTRPTMNSTPNVGMGGGMPDPGGMPGAGSAGGGGGGGMPGGGTRQGGAAGTGLPPGATTRPILGGMSNIDAMDVAPANMKVEEEGESVRNAPRPTGLPGVVLWTAPTASGALTAMGRNISLDAGTHMTLGVIAR